MEAMRQQFFNLAIMERALPLLLMGLRQTLLLCLLLVPLGLFGGLIAALLSRSRVRRCALAGDGLHRFFPRGAAAGAADLHLFGPAVRGIAALAFDRVAIAFFLNTSSYYGEIYRAGIESIRRGQWEAARSTGLSACQAMIYVVLPQAVRNVLPDLVSNTRRSGEAHLDRQRCGAP